MKKKIIILAGFSEEKLQSLDDNFELIWIKKEDYTKEKVMSLLPNADVFIPNSKFYIDKEIIDSGKNLKLIANFGAGYDEIDADYASQKGITVTNTPRSVLEPTAELCFGLVVSLMRKITYYDRHIRQLEGSFRPLNNEWGTGLYGKMFGIFGMGKIGQAVARRAKAFGMNIIYHNRKPVNSSIEKELNAEYVSFDELLIASDVLSLNAPATDETHHLMSESAFRQMKPTAFLVNASRGSVVDEKALIKALKEKLIAGAALDVFENEPLVGRELKEMENVVLTPHAGTQTLEARNEMYDELIENIRGFFEGKKVSKVN